MSTQETFEDDLAYLALASMQLPVQVVFKSPFSEH